MLGSAGNVEQGYIRRGSGGTSLAELITAGNLTAIPYLNVLPKFVTE
jgi:hypothetical protein